MKRACICMDALVNVFVIIVKCVILQCVFAAQLILDICILRIQLRASEQQMVYSLVSLYLRILGSGINRFARGRACSN